MYVIGDDVMSNRRKIAALGALSLAFGLYQNIKGKKVKSIRPGNKKVKGIFKANHKKADKRIQGILKGNHKKADKKIKGILNDNQKKANTAITKAFKKGKKIVNVKPGKGNFIFKKK